MTLKRLLILMPILVLVCGTYAQMDTTLNRITNFPSRFFDKINNKTANLEARLERQTEKYLQRLAKKEQRLKRKLLKVDSNAANSVFNNSEQQYAELAGKLKSGTLDATYLFRWKRGRIILKATEEVLSHSGQASKGYL